MSTGCLFFALLAFQMSSSSTAILKDCFYNKEWQIIGCRQILPNLLRDGQAPLAAQFRYWDSKPVLLEIASKHGFCCRLSCRSFQDSHAGVSCLHAVPTLHVCVSVTIHPCLELLHHTISFSTTLPTVFDAGLNTDSFFCLPPRCLCCMRWYPGSCWLGARSRTPGPTSTLTVASCCSTTA
jgi:hypothetical protein